MIVALKEVLVELTDFATGKEIEKKAAPSSSPVTQVATEVKDALALYTSQVQSAAVRVPASANSEPQKVGVSVGEYRFDEGRAFVAIEGLFCYQRPVRALDTIIGTLRYGMIVEVIGYQGRWAHVERAGEKAWVEKDGLVSEKTDVLPDLEVGSIYDVYHPDTTKIRAILNDEFAAAELALPLQDIEYVTYRLHVKQRMIPWPTVRPRVSGRWHQLLRGQKGIHMSVRPTTGSLMEYSRADGSGQLLYVDAVYPDESIEVEAVGEQIEGRFDKKKVSPEVWRSFGPTFIEIR
ncbi:MAG: SH3 domain-containing protein [Patescibacteria group bacterium]